jgi:amino-acid N-acetyltransferase
VHEVSGAGAVAPLLAEVRRARTRDVPGIRALVDANTADRRLLEKATVTLYEDLQEFFVAVDGERVVGCGALHVLWEDLAEVRTLAVDRSVQGRGIGAALLSRLVENARDLGVRRLFCLTFEVDFFRRHGFVPVSESIVDPGVQAELLQSPDEGVAEFLDLERVKPNTLGNTRMLALLPPDGAVEQRAAGGR